jgi:hypothetical protein
LYQNFFYLNSTSTSQSFTARALSRSEFPPRAFEKIQRHLEFAGNLIGQDAPLDWEDRETACRQICDALCALRFA